MSIQISVCALVYSVFILMLYLGSWKLYNNWNAKTHTISDYTVKYWIPDAEYNHYKDFIFQSDVYTNVNFGFSNYMKQ